MSYERLFKVDEKGVGQTITGIPCELIEDKEDGNLHLTLHYDKDLEALLIAPIGRDIEPLLKELIEVVPLRPRRPKEEPSLSKVVGGIIEAMHTEGLTKISILGLRSTPFVFVKVRAVSDIASYIISGSELGAKPKCKFTTWSADDDIVLLEFSGALNISFNQFKSCFE